MSGYAKMLVCCSFQGGQQCMCVFVHVCVCEEFSRKSACMKPNDTMSCPVLSLENNGV